MGSKRQFHKLVIPDSVKIGRNSTVGGTVIGDYIGGPTMSDRVIVVEMPKMEKKAGKKAKPRARNEAAMSIAEAAGVTNG